MNEYRRLFTLGKETGLGSPNQLGTNYHNMGID